MLKNFGDFGRNVATSTVKFTENVELPLGTFRYKIIQNPNNNYYRYKIIQNPKCMTCT